MVCPRCQRNQHHLCVAVAAINGIKGITWCDCGHRRRRVRQKKKDGKDDPPRDQR